METELYRTTAVRRLGPARKGKSSLASLLSGRAMASSDRVPAAAAAEQWELALSLGKQLRALGASDAAAAASGSAAAFISACKACCNATVRSSRPHSSPRPALADSLRSRRLRRKYGVGVRIGRRGAALRRSQRAAVAVHPREKKRDASKKNSSRRTGRGRRAARRPV